MWIYYILASEQQICELKVALTNATNTISSMKIDHHNLQSAQQDRQASVAAAEEQALIRLKELQQVCVVQIIIVF